MNLRNFQETVFVYLSLCTVHVHNNIHFHWKNCRFAVTNFVTLFDEFYTGLNWLLRGLLENLGKTSVVFLCAFLRKIRGSISALAVICTCKTTKEYCMSLAGVKLSFFLPFSKERKNPQKNIMREGGKALLPI